MSNLAVAPVRVRRAGMQIKSGGLTGELAEAIDPAHYQEGWHSTGLLTMLAPRARPA